jgi:hypothetical protein
VKAEPSLIAACWSTPRQTSWRGHRGVALLLGWTKDEIVGNDGQGRAEGFIATPNMANQGGSSCRLRYHCAEILVRRICAVWRGRRKTAPMPVGFWLLQRSMTARRAPRRQRSAVSASSEMSARRRGGRIHEFVFCDEVVIGVVDAEELPIREGLTVGKAHLRRILREYSAYYNGLRTHRALNQDTPVRRAVQTNGTIKSRPVLGGLHHQYCRI